MIKKTTISVIILNLKTSFNFDNIYINDKYSSKKFRL